MINNHLPHIEELALEGVSGAVTALTIISLILSKMAGNNIKVLKMSTKYDGSPSVFIGIDPEDGAFFVAKKSIFNKEPEVYKSIDGIYEMIDNIELANKMMIIFNTCSQLGIKEGIYQGDLMFTKDDIITGLDSYYFKTNTLEYFVPINSELGNDIVNAQCGIVFHTKYSGPSLKKLKAEFGAPISEQFKNFGDLWCIDATYNFDEVTSTLDNDVFRNIHVNIFKLLEESYIFIEAVDNTEKAKLLFKRYYNNCIRKGYYPSGNYVDFIRFVHEYYDDIKRNRKMKSTKRRYQAEKEKLIEAMPQEHVENFLTIINNLNYLKISIINDLNKNSVLGVDGAHEGYVASFYETSVKLVDRTEFSHQNFKKND